MNRNALASLPILLLFLLPTACRKHEEAPDLIRPVRTMRVGDATQLSRLVFPGRAEAAQAVDMAFEVQGQLIERPVNMGDEVKKNQVLARLDPRDYENDCQAALARLEQAKAFFERIEKAAKTGSVSQQELTDARARRDMATADVSIKKKAIDDTKLVAPFDGTIAATYLENFQNVQRKQIVLRLLDTSKMELQINIPEHLIMLAPYLQDITITFESYPDSPVSGQVKEIGTEASATTRTYPITMIMEQPSKFKILAGMTGMVRGKPKPPGTADDPGLEILGAAVFEEGGKSYVWVVDEASTTVQQREVHPTAVTSYGVRVEGLEAGQTIVTAGAHHLIEGQKIRLMDKADKVEETK